MKKFTIFGNPVAHSKSPKMHNSAFDGLNIQANYSKTLLEDGSKLKEKFLELGVDGANITLPHKEEAFRICDKVDSFASRVGAVNTIVKKDNKLYGYNTDASGFLRAIRMFNLDIKTILIIGAGGTSKAISRILQDEGYIVTILNRSASRLESFEGFERYTFNDFKPKKYDLIVNSTSAGLEDDSLPMPQDMLISILENAKASIDVVYGKETPFLKLSKSLNIPSKDGSDMLLFQGVIAFEKFTNHQFTFEEIEKFMKKAF
ncbi:Shikimate 5-dehydrogenase I alpha [hydrothermal vent metagenome]|uniref:shikimate dehydrogenase (NADP(+)) n=1 Tax=hydrothermal vent metagenome TaxID=652676 RepID=A0A1W1EKT0_9ZZZZ